MKAIETRTQVQAPPDKVWSILTDLENYASWNPFITRARGELLPGNKLEIHRTVPGGKPMIVHPTVTSIVPGRQLVWTEKTRIPRCFDVDHIFEVHPAGDNVSTLVQRKVFRGMLVPFVWSSLPQSTRITLEEINEALRARAENNG
ncbi:MAG: SRPBCC domain-containing protein [Dehalococcoidia bacterium]